MDTYDFIVNLPIDTEFIFSDDLVFKKVYRKIDDDWIVPVNDETIKIKIKSHYIASFTKYSTPIARYWIYNSRIKQKTNIILCPFCASKNRARFFMFTPELKKEICEYCGSSLEQIKENLLKNGCPIVPFTYY